MDQSKSLAPTGRQLTFEIGVQIWNATWQVKKAALGNLIWLILNLIFRIMPHIERVKPTKVLGIFHILSGEWQVTTAPGQPPANGNFLTMKEKVINFETRRNERQIANKYTDSTT